MAGPAGPGRGLATIAVARTARDLRFESTGVTAFRNSAVLGIRVMDYNVARIGLEEGLRYSGRDAAVPNARASFLTT
jgi:hypothetical protein